MRRGRREVVFKWLSRAIASQALMRSTVPLITTRGDFSNVCSSRFVTISAYMKSTQSTICFAPLACIGVVLNFVRYTMLCNSMLPDRRWII